MQRQNMQTSLKRFNIFYLRYWMLSGSLRRAKNAKSNHTNVTKTRRKIQQNWRDFLPWKGYFIGAHSNYTETHK